MADAEYWKQCYNPSDETIKSQGGGITLAIKKL